MKAKALLFVSLIVFGIISCKKNDPDIPKNHLQVPKIEEVLNGGDQQLISLLNKVRGSVGRRGPASKAIWSRKTIMAWGCI